MGSPAARNRRKVQRRHLRSAKEAEAILREQEPELWEARFFREAMDTYAALSALKETTNGTSK